MEKEIEKYAAETFNIQQKHLDIEVQIATLEARRKANDTNLQRIEQHYTRLAERNEIEDNQVHEVEFDGFTLHVQIENKECYDIDIMYHETATI